MIASKIYKSVGPLVIAALSLFFWTYCIQLAMDYYGLGIWILSEKNMGKILFTVLALLHVDLFFRLQSRAYVDQFYATVFGFWSSWQSFADFFYYFLLFFCMHLLVLSFFIFLGYASYIPFVDALTISFFKKSLWGFVATFFLAWTEEAIFRAGLFQHFRRCMSEIVAIVVTSFCFMVAHSLQNPVHFFVHEWRIAVGLFLFGFMLNSLYASTGKLITNMGAHAGTVFVKVLQRRILFIQFVPSIQSVWLIDGDLRQSLLAYVLFFIFGVYFLYQKNTRKAFFRVI